MSTLFAEIEGINTAALADMTEVKSGGGARRILPAGTAIVRLSSYIEFGKHVQTFNGQPKPPALQFKLGFHIVGGGGTNEKGEGEPYVLEEGNFPQISTFDTAMSQHEKSKAVKLFKALNSVGNTATHFVQKVSEQCLYQLQVKVIKKGDKTYNDFNFVDMSAAINPVTYKAYGDNDMPKLEDKHIQVFLWSQPSPAQWASIHIEGEWEAQVDKKTGEQIKPARSKNFLQEKCLTAIDFEGSPLQVMLGELGSGYSIPELSTEPEVVQEAPQEAPAEGSVSAPDLDEDDIL